MVKKLNMSVFIPKKIFPFIFFICFCFPVYGHEFTYQVYAGGLHVVEATFKYDSNNDNYQASVNAKTRGWLSSLVPWSGIFKTDGYIKDGIYTPKLHQSISEWKKKIETKTFTYDQSNLISLVIEEKGRIEKPEIDTALTENTTDILSSTLNVMNDILKTGKCDGASDIYDGKRRFTMYFKDKGENVLPQSRYNIFSGPARNCNVEIEPKGGKWHEKPRGWLLIQEQGRQKGALPTVWMAKVDGFEQAIPVKIQVKTDYGTLLMHLTNAK